MIKLDNVSLVFQGGSVALSNVSTEISEGEFVYLIGHSGSGKSSLLKLLYKEYSPTKGEIEVVDMDVTSLPKWKIPLLRRKLGIVTQEPQLLEEKEIDEKTSTLIDLVGLNDSMYKFPSQLSGGEQTRACIARALASNPLVLLCDEPTGNLDPELSIQIITLLEKINRAGTTVLMATHDSSIVNRRKKRVLQLKDGKLMSDVDQGRYV
jgi:cell division transport system ATP-binding protein